MNHPFALSNPKLLYFLSIAGETLCQLLGFLAILTVVLEPRKIWKLQTLSQLFYFLRNISAIEYMNRSHRIEYHACEQEQTPCTTNVFVVIVSMGGGSYGCERRNSNLKSDFSLLKNDGLRLYTLLLSTIHF
jgi:hypothetical protein